MLRRLDRRFVAWQRAARQRSGHRARRIVRGAHDFDVFLGVQRSRQPLRRAAGITGLALVAANGWIIAAAVGTDQPVAQQPPDELPAPSTDQAPDESAFELGPRLFEPVDAYAARAADTLEQPFNGQRVAVVSLTGPVSAADAAVAWRDVDTPIVAVRIQGESVEYLRRRERESVVDLVQAFSAAVDERLDRRRQWISRALTRVGSSHQLVDPAAQMLASLTQQINTRRVRDEVVVGAVVVGSHAALQSLADDALVRAVEVGGDRTTVSLTSFAILLHTDRDTVTVGLDSSG